jgi:hypothetical protein
MEHIAKAIQKDPVDVRLKNLKKDDSNVQKIIEDLKVTADFEQRKQNVEEFNKVSGEVYLLLFSFSTLLHIINKSNAGIFNVILLLTWKHRSNKRGNVCTYNITQARSRNHCCYGKAASIKYSDFVSVFCP